MPPVVICYQNGDASDILVDALHLALLKFFGDGEVGVGVGATPAEVQASIEACHSMVVVIGNHWQPDALQKQAIVQALARHKHVVVVLAEGAALPVNLPRELGDLARLRPLMLHDPYGAIEITEIIDRLEGGTAGLGATLLETKELDAISPPPAPRFVAHLRQNTPLLSHAIAGANSLRQLGAGQRVEVIRQQEGYFQVNVNDQLGWVAEQAVALVQDDAVTNISAFPAPPPPSMPVIQPEVVPAKPLPTKPPTRPLAAVTGVFRTASHPQEAISMNDIIVTVFFILLLVILGGAAIVMALSALT